MSAFIQFVFYGGYFLMAVPTELGWISVVALFSTYFFMPVMFPTIFALGIKDLGPLTRKSSSFLGNGYSGLCQQSIWFN